MQLRYSDITDKDVLAAMAAVPRHEFVPEGLVEEAYEDHPLPIGYGQTISQPYIVALMTQLLQPKREDRVLEIGTGSGYQAAILSCLTKEVYTVEIIAALAREAEQRLRRLGYCNVHVKHGDGYFGWPEHAPYDAIVVTAAAEEVPEPLLDQLKEGGRLVIPIGREGATQALRLLEKKGEEVIKTDIVSVIFVPFTRKQTGSEPKRRT